MAPHQSTAGHLATETALLGALYKRSKDQHRSQIFLQRLEGVLRLSKRVIKAVAAAAPVSSSNVENYTALAELIPRLLHALVTAARASDAVLALGYFVPLHAALLAGYARLFAVALALANALGIDPYGATEVVKPEKRRAAPEVPRLPAEQTAPTPTPSLLSAEIGERIERASASTSRANSHTPMPAGLSSTPPLKRKNGDGGVMAKKRKKGLSLGTGESRTPSGATTPVESDDNGPRPESSLSSTKHKLAGPSSAVFSKTSSPKIAATPAGSTPSTPGTFDADRPKAVADHSNVPSLPPKMVKNKSKEDKAAKSGKESGKAKDKSKKRRKQDAMDDIFGF